MIPGLGGVGGPGGDDLSGMLGECMCICMFTCLCACTCVYVRVYVYAHMYVHTHVYAYVCVYEYVYAYVCLRVCDEMLRYDPEHQYGKNLRLTLLSIYIISYMNILLGDLNLSQDEMSSLTQLLSGGGPGGEGGPMGGDGESLN